MKPFIPVILILFLATGIVLFGILPVSAQSDVVFTVNSADDLDDGTCDASHCSLREAINANNQTSDGVIRNFIRFNIPGAGVHTIQPTTPLPKIIRHVVVDGTSQPGYAVGAPVIELNGTNVVTAVPEDNIGLYLSNYDGSGLNSAVRGLVINGFAYAGILLNTTYHALEGNFIGTNADGTQAVPNGYGLVLKNASQNSIGGTTPEQRNVISGNTVDGIYINGGSASNGDAYNRIIGNYIGLNATGTAALGNGGNGISITASRGNLVGGTAQPEQRNVISGNLQNGILVKGPQVPTTRIYGNYIGTDATATNLVGNAQNGVRMESADGIEIGDDDYRTPPNIIAGNGQNGIQAVGTDNLYNAIQHNSIYDNAQLGIDLGADGVTANDPGDADNGPDTLQNFPVLTKAITAPTQTSIVGTLQSKPNSYFILDFFASPACDPSGYGEGKTYLGSSILTTDSAGNAAFTSSMNGTTPGYFVTAIASHSDFPTYGYGSREMSEFSACTPALDAAHNGLTFTVNTTNDTDDGVCNAAHCSLHEALNAANNVVGLDTIRFNIPGGGTHTIIITSILPDVTSGVIIDGTTQPGYAGKPLVAIAGANYYYCSLRITSNLNLIRGLLLYGDCALRLTGNENVVQANYFGTDFSGLVMTSVNQGGLQIGGVGNLIGGTNPADRNLIVAHDAGFGFTVYGDNNRVQGNYIGVDVTGQIVLSDILSGITIKGNNNLIGGTAPGAGNIIAGSEFNGVAVTQGHGNAILGNSILVSRHDGIDLDNNVHSELLNDLGDADDGPNGYQNAPQLTLALKSDAGASITGTLNSLPNNDYRIEFFANQSCSIWGYGEGQIYLGAGTATTGGDGNATFTVDVPGSAPEWYAVTATATDPDNNTSEFSACSPFITAASAPLHAYYRTRTVTLSWEGTSWALGYSVQVYRDPAVNKFPYDYNGGGSIGPNGRSITLTLPNFDSLYYWRVGAWSPDGTIHWSQVQTFMVDLP